MLLRTRLLLAYLYAGQSHVKHRKERLLNWADQFRKSWRHDPFYRRIPHQPVHKLRDHRRQRTVVLRDPVNDMYYLGNARW